MILREDQVFFMDMICQPLQEETSEVCTNK